MSKKSQSHGFSLVVVLVTVAVIAAAGSGGWYVWQKNKNSELTDNKAASSIQNNSSKENKSVQNDPSENSKYLVIEEWGVEIPLSDEISKAYYLFRSDDSGEYAELYDADFDNEKNANGVSCGGVNKFQLYSISRVKSKDINLLSELDRSRFQKFSFTDEWMFSGIGAHQAPPPCSNLNSDLSQPYQEDTNVLEIAERKEEAFNNAFGDLQPIE